MHFSNVHGFENVPVPLKQSHRGRHRRFRSFVFVACLLASVPAYFTGSTISSGSPARPGNAPNAGYTANAGNALNEIESMARFESYVEDLSRRTYKRMVGSRYPFRRVKNHPDLGLLRELADSIARASGRAGHDKPIAVVRLVPAPKMANALTLPGGQIIFMEGMMHQCRRRARKLAAENTGLNKTLGRKKAERHHYRGLLTAVMGHELAHFYGRHFVRRQMRSLKNTGSGARTISPEKLRYNQSQELESDAFAQRMLLALHMDVRYMKELLLILKRQSQTRIRRGRSKNPYFATHPSGNVRLARMEQNKNSRRYYQRMADLESAFAAVETGHNLKKAESTLQDELKRFPGNPYLLGVQAKIRHRLWEASCSVEEILFKPSIAAASFYDRMVMAPITMRAGASSQREVPCDQDIYKRAVQSYRVAIKNRAADPSIQSSFAALLAYDPATSSESLQRVMAALKNVAKTRRIARFQILNNAGIVFYWNKDTAGAEKAFRRASGLLLRVMSSKRRSRRRYAAKYRRRQKLLSQFSAKNTNKYAEAVFNLGQLHFVRGHQKIARRVWKRYAQILDSSSDWAKYAASRTGMDLAKLRPLPPLRVRGIAPGAPILFLIKRMGDPTRKSGRRGIDIWNYDKQGLRFLIRNGVVIRIYLSGDSLSGKSAIALDMGIGPGMPRVRVEKMLGRPPLQRGSRVVYPRRKMMIEYKGKKLRRLQIRL